MHACHSVSAACEARQQRGKIGSVQRSILVGQIGLNGRQRVITIALSEDSSMYESQFNKLCWFVVQYWSDPSCKAITSQWEPHVHQSVQDTDPVLAILQYVFCSLLQSTPDTFLFYLILSYSEKGVARQNLVKLTLVCKTSFAWSLMFSSFLLCIFHLQCESLISCSRPTEMKRDKIWSEHSLASSSCEVGSAVLNKAAYSVEILASGHHHHLNMHFFLRFIKGIDGCFSTGNSIR